MISIDIILFFGT